MATDRIEREITINAPRERVWAALTEAKHVARWFGDTAEVDLRPGGTMRISHGEGFDYPLRLVRVEPPHFLSYRWASAYPGEQALDDNSTLVEFTLTAAGGGTRLQVVESGFARISIPPDREPTAGYDSHSEGWTGKLEELRGYVEQLPV